MLAVFGGVRVKSGWLLEGPFRHIRGAGDDDYDGDEMNSQETPALPFRQGIDRPRTRPHDAGSVRSDHKSRDGWD
jgi:hypothetical protein